MKKTALLLASVCLSLANSQAADDRSTTTKPAGDNVAPGYHNTEAPKPRTDSTVTERRIDANGRIETTATATATATAGAAITKASDLMGTKVKNAKGETLGSISDVALDLNSGKINYVVLSSGGILGFRDRLYAVPVNALRRSTEEKTFIFDVDKEALQSTAGFIKNNWPDRADEALMQRINRNANTEVIREPAGGRVKVEADDSKLKVEKDGDTKFKAERKN